MNLLINSLSIGSFSLFLSFSPFSSLFLSFSLSFSLFLALTMCSYYVTHMIFELDKQKLQDDLLAKKSLDVYSLVSQIQDMNKQKCEVALALARELVEENCLSHGIDKWSDKLFHYIHTMQTSKVNSLAFSEACIFATCISDPDHNPCTSALPKEN